MSFGSVGMGIATYLPKNIVQTMEEGGTQKQLSMFTRARIATKGMASLSAFRIGFISA